MDFVTIAPLTVDVLDDWWRVLGIRLELPGGTTLRATDSRWVHLAESGEAALRVDDPYLPPFIAQVPKMSLDAMAQVLAAGASGPRVGQARTACSKNHRTRRHAAEDRCLACFYERWRRRADTIRFQPRDSNG